MIFLVKHLAVCGDQTPGSVWGPNTWQCVGTKRLAVCGDQTPGSVWRPNAWQCVVTKTNYEICLYVIFPLPLSTPLSSTK
jgi:hypothetical protein